MYDDIDNLISGTLLITVPHMDDEILGCGGLLARFKDKHNVHLLYTCDGAGSDSLRLPGMNAYSREKLTEIRTEESVRATALIGIPSDQLYFMNIPDGRLDEYDDVLYRELDQLMDDIRPDYVLTPFRFDKHPDHIALNAITRDVVLHRDEITTILEYFVYYWWRLLPGRDVRLYCDPDNLIEMDISDYAAIKREAMACFKSQCTTFFEGQNRPILSKSYIDDLMDDPECFLRVMPSTTNKDLFSISPFILKTLNTLEPCLKRYKREMFGIY